MHAHQPSNEHHAALPATLRDNVERAVATDKMTDRWFYFRAA
jgi:hypothetical protein